jgi:predicted amidohydrolase
VRVELAQLSPAPRDLAANVERVTAVLGEATADLVVFPELFLCGYQLEDLEELTMTIDDPHVGALRDAARAADRALIVGILEADGGGVFNSALCIDRDGSLAGSHRKTHLFGGERGVFDPGDALEPVLLAGRTVGVMICFEVEFPEVARTLVRRGADLLVTVSANMDPYGPDHDLLGRARALENNRPHLYVNRVGKESGLCFAGESRVIDPMGGVLTVAARGESLLACDVPAAELRSAQTSYLAQSRPELYS